MIVGSPPPSPRPGALWASARTILVLAGLGFVTAAAVAACLDHYDESSGCEAAASLAAGSGEGSAATPADCGAPAAAADDAGEATGSGSGSAAAP